MLILFCGVTLDCLCNEILFGRERVRREPLLSMRLASYFGTFIAVAFTSLLVSYLVKASTARVDVLYRTFCRLRDQTGATPNTVDLYSEVADACKTGLL